MLIISGEIKKGRGLGRKMGFPTINLPYDGDEFGVYAGQVKVDGLLYKAAVHLGAKPTLGDEAPVCEAFLLDWEAGSLVGKLVEVRLFKKIREVEKFDSLDALKFQIAKDVTLIENLLK